MKKKQQIKDLKSCNSILESKLFAANQDADKWKDSCEYWENQYNAIQKVGMLLVKASDYKTLLDESFKAGQYKKALAEKEQLLHESNVTKDALKERLDTSKEQSSSCMDTLKEIAALLEMDEHSPLIDTPKAIEELCASFAHVNARAEKLLDDNRKQREKVDAQEWVIEALQANNKRLSKNYKQQDADKENEILNLKVAALNAELERIRHVSDVRATTKDAPNKIYADTANAPTEKKECEKWCGLNYCDENGCNDRVRNNIEPIPKEPKLNTVNGKPNFDDLAKGLNKDRPCTEKEKSFCADCGLVCRKK